MTTEITIKHSDKNVFIYLANLDENKDGDFKLLDTLTEGEKTYSVHSAADLMITENELDD